MSCLLCQNIFLEVFIFYSDFRQDTEVEVKYQKTLLCLTIKLITPLITIALVAHRHVA